MTTISDVYLAMFNLYVAGMAPTRQEDDLSATTEEIIALEEFGLICPVIRPDGQLGIALATPLTAEQRAELLRLAELDRIEDETHVSQFGWL